MIFAILHRYARGRYKVEDLAQETFVKAWRVHGHFDGRAPLEHWLSKIAVHVALDHLRRERRRQNEIKLFDFGEDVLDWLRCEDRRQELDSRQEFHRGFALIITDAQQEISPILTPERRQRFEKFTKEPRPFWRPAQ